MPRSSKKKRPNPQEEDPSSSSSSDDEMNDEEQEENHGEENIQVDLEARSPIDTDQPAILYFLEQSFGHAIKKSILDLNQLAMQLVAQSSCGSVFYQPADSTIDDDDDDEDSPVLGICSILRFDQQLNKQLQTWFLEKCSNNQQAKTILQTSKCALFVNERYMNIPADISLPAIRSLRSEIPYQIDYWLVHAKLRIHKNDSNTIYYINGEEEILKDHSALSIDYHPTQPDGDEWIQRRRILFVSTEKLDQICSDIEQKLNQ